MKCMKWKLTLNLKNYWDPKHAKDYFESCTFCLETHLKFWTTVWFVSIWIFLSLTFFFETHISGCGKTRCNYWYFWSLFWEYNTSDEPISKGICGLAYAKCKEASLTVNSAGTDTHGVPSNLVEHHTDAIDLVRLDVDGPVEDDFDHWVSANLGREVGVSQSASFGVE